MTALDANTAEHVLDDSLPAALLERLEALSPIGHLAEVDAPLLLLAHDRDHSVRTVGESRRLVAALSGRSGVRELTRLVHAVYPLFRQAF